MIRLKFIFSAILWLAIGCPTAFAQGSTIIDSIKLILRSANSDSIKAKAYADLSWNYAITRTQLDSAKLYTDSLKLLSIETGDDEGVVKSDFYYGLINRFEGKHIDGLRHLENYVEFHQKNGDSVKMAFGLYQIGVMQNALGNYPESFRAYHRILNIYRENGKLNSIGSTLNSLAHIQRKLKRYDEAIKSYEESITIHEGLNDLLDLSNSLESLGNTYRELHEFEKAESYLYRALRTAKAINVAYRIATIHENLGNLYYEMGKFEQALSYHLESLRSRENQPSKRYLAISLNKVGNTYAKLEKLILAKKYLTESQKIAEEIDAKPILADTYKSLKEIHKVLGDMNEAFRYQELFMIVNDSILNVENNRQLAELETKYQSARKDQEITLLTKENEVQQAKTDRQTTLQNALIGGIILLTIIAGLVFNTLSQRLKNQKIIAAKNEEIKISNFKKELGALEMKALRAQMNPHFLFNCMNSINTMILSDNNTDASKYLTKFSRLVRLMLENSEKPKVTLRDELNMLSAYIELESIRFKGKIDYTIKVNEIVDEDTTLIPSMVLQPFVENAIWHGLLHNKKEGKLSVKIEEENDFLHCTISDNGVGRQASLMLQRRAKLKKNSMGIKITTDRLRLLNMGKVKEAVKICDLVDEADNPAGTQVDILIPIS